MAVVEPEEEETEEIEGSITEEQVTVQNDSEQIQTDMQKFADSLFDEEE